MGKIRTRAKQRSQERKAGIFRMDHYPESHKECIAYAIKLEDEIALRDGDVFPIDYRGAARERVIERIIRLEETLLRLERNHRSWDRQIPF